MKSNINAFHRRRNHSKNKEYFRQDSIDSIYDAIKTVDVHLKNITLVMKNM